MVQYPTLCVKIDELLNKAARMDAKASEICHRNPKFASTLTDEASRILDVLSEVEDARNRMDFARINFLLRGM